MPHPELVSLLQRRLKTIADHNWRERDPAAHLDALKSVSEEITRWHQAHQSQLGARLNHFLSGCSYDKALAFLQADSAV